MPVDTQRLKKEHTFAAKGTTLELLTDLASIEQMVARRKKFKKILVFSGVAVLLAGIALAILVSGGLLWPGAALAIGIWIWAAFQGADFVGHQTRVSFVHSLLERLGDDSGRNPFSITLKLKKAREQLSSKKTHRTKGIEALYKEPWLDIEGKLVDGTVFSENLTDLIRERKWANPRGKTKRKERILQVMTLRLVYPPSRYGDLSPVALKLKDAFRIPAGTIIKAVKPSEKALAVKAVLRTGDLKPANESVLLGAYRIMNLARREVAASKRSGSGA